MYLYLAVIASGRGDRDIAKSSFASITWSIFAVIFDRLLLTVLYRGIALQSTIVVYDRVTPRSFLSRTAILSPLLLLRGSLSSSLYDAIALRSAKLVGGEVALRPDRIEIRRVTILAI